MQHWRKKTGSIAPVKKDIAVVVVVLHAFFFLDYTL